MSSSLKTCSDSWRSGRNKTRTEYAVMAYHLNGHVRRLLRRYQVKEHLVVTGLMLVEIAILIPVGYFIHPLLAVGIFIVLPIIIALWPARRDRRNR
jgi:hypothetical protein